MNEKLQKFLEDLEWSYGPNYMEFDESRETYYNLLKQFENEQ